MRGVEFEAGGKVRSLRFGINALCALEKQTGRKVGDIFQSLEGDLTLFRAVVKAGCGPERLTDDQVGDLIDEIGLVKSADLLKQAFAEAFPQATPGEAQAET